MIHPFRTHLNLLLAAPRSYRSSLARPCEMDEVNYKYRNLALRFRDANFYRTDIPSQCSVTPLNILGNTCSPSLSSKKRRCRLPVKEEVPKVSRKSKDSAHLPTPRLSARTRLRLPADLSRALRQFDIMPVSVLGKVEIWLLLKWSKTTPTNSC